MTLTVSQVWGVLGLLFVVLFGMGSFHMDHLLERLKELQCHDAQVKYFGTVSSWFIMGVPFGVALACCFMMVYTDFKAIAS